MALPDVVMQSAFGTVEAYCEQRLPAHVQDQVRMEATMRGKAITIWERRPPFRPEYGPDWSKTKIAQLRFESASRLWSLWWADRNGRWRAYPAPLQPTVEAALATIEADPVSAFYG